MSKIKMSFLGAGSYGTAVAGHFARFDDYEVRIFGRDPEVVGEINAKHTNGRYLGGSQLSKNLKASNDLSETVDGSDILFFAVPAQEVRKVALQVRDVLSGNEFVVINLAKGLEIEGFKRMSQVLDESLGETSPRIDIMTLSGPSFARDVVDPAKSVALSLGGRNRRRLKKVRGLLHSETFRIFACKDLVGVEMGGALKNVFALMAGIMKGSGEGDSYLGEYIPRALVEIDTVKRYFGARRDTARAVSSLGDLIISCAEASRNFRFGKAYAENYALSGSREDSLAKSAAAVDHKTVEGMHTLKAVHGFVVKRNMFAPIVRELHDVFYGTGGHEKSPSDAVASFRQADSLRTWENLRTYSRMLGSIFPHFWFRRYSSLWSRDKDSEP